ncbi:D-alanyl-D-alanine carboxypeptidase family protein [Paenibacillus hubeiensis]|uniref:D-alanyl-D-alanine carboxypeptidase family protein n=1 Tax=Paenibacillus hubeiensis TaxID=3077330 RepID=UPI003F64CE6B
MKAKRTNKNKRQLLKKSVASMMLVNMLCMSAVMPVMAAANNSGQVLTAAATKTQTAKAAQIPSVDSLGLKVKSAILMEASTGEVLLNVNANEAMPPASMTKMMTEYIVAEQVKQGKFSWDDVVEVKDNAAKSIGSRIFLAKGDKHTVKELYIAMAVGSANDATVALAEYVAGSEAEFVKMMNEEAQRMGMKDTYFINSTGLDRADMPEDYRPAEDKETVMSAYDAAILCRYIIKDHPDYKDFTTIQSYKFRPNDKAPIINYNWMLEANKDITNFKSFAYEGLDGMKTGHTTKAGNNFTGTAERNGLRYISVVMGTTSEAARFTETRKVLDYGFNNFEVKQAVAAKTKVTGLESVPLKKGSETTVPVVTDNAVSFVVPKGTQNLDVTFKTNVSNDNDLVAPIKAGTKVGTVTYTYKADGMEPQEKTVNLITAEDAEKGGWFRLFFRAIKDFFVDLFDGIKNLF